MDPLIPKFPMNFAQSVADVFRKETIKLELISNLHLDPAECKSREKTSCKFVIDPKNFLSCDDFQADQEIKKTAEICEFILESMRENLVELKEKQTFEQLVRKVDVAAAKSFEFYNLLENLKALKKTEKEVLLKIRKRTRILNDEEKKIVNEVWQKRVSKQQISFELRWKKSFNELWIKSQLGQHDLKIIKVLDETNEKSYHDTVDWFLATDVCTKVSKFYREKIKDLQESAREMESLYDNQIETLETKFQEAVGEKRRLHAMIQQEQDFFQKRKNEMYSYLEMKRKKKAEKELLELQKISIIVIQSWWRGIMVRNHLGRFKEFKKREKQIKKEFRARRKQAKTGKTAKK
jgi:IQ calmodulin-binding motif